MLRLMLMVLTLAWGGQVWAASSMLPRYCVQEAGV